MSNVTSGVDQLQIDALRAAFAPRETAMAAWEAIRRRHSFRTMPDPVARLCGKICRNLRLSEGHPDRDRLRGAFKSNHVYGTFHLTGVLRALRELERQGVPYLVVKGAAVALHAGTFGVRRLGDIDVAVSIDDVGRAHTALAGVGFKPKSPDPWDGRRRPRWQSCGPVVEHRGAELDLMVSGTRRSDMISAFLRSPPCPIDWVGHRLHVASREQTLLLSLVHGYHAGAESDFIQSLADVALLIRSANIEELRRWAERCRLGFMLDAACGRLVGLGLLDPGQWSAAVPKTVPHARLRARVLRRQGKFRPDPRIRFVIGKSRAIWRLGRRWRGLTCPPDVSRGVSLREITYRAWLVGLRMAVIERLLLRSLGSLLPGERTLRAACGETLVIEADPSTWDFRFRVEWPLEEDCVVSIRSDFDPECGPLLSVYESGRCRGKLPGPGADPLILRPSGGRRGVEVSIRVLEHPWPDRTVRCHVSLTRV